MERNSLMIVQNQELAHYGVKGMKWGVRKGRYYKKYAAKAKRKQYDYESEAKNLRKRGDTDAARTAQLAANKQKAKAKHLQTAGDINATRSRGTKIVANLLAGPFANRTYNNLVAAGKSKAFAAGATYVTGYLGGPLGHMLVSSIVANDAYRRSGGGA